jgi:hypothetical protein
MHDSKVKSQSVPQTTGHAYTDNTTYGVHCSHRLSTLSAVHNGKVNFAPQRYVIDITVVRISSDTGTVVGLATKLETYDAEAAGLTPYRYRRFSTSMPRVPASRACVQVQLPARVLNS